MSYTYRGTKITGTSTAGKVFKKSGIKKASKGQTYFNKSTGHVYKCTAGGKASEAKWKYLRTDIAKKPTVAVAGLGAPVRESGTRKMKATWKTPVAMIDERKGDRATALSINWYLGIAGKDPKKVVKTSNEKLMESTINLSNLTIGEKTYKRADFYPFENKPKLNYVTVKVTSKNAKGSGASAKATREFVVPRKPTISEFSFDVETGEVSCTIDTDVGDDYHERYDTRYKMTVYYSDTKETKTIHDTRTTETSKTIVFDDEDYASRSYEDYAKVTVQAWARGYKGDSDIVEKVFYVSYPSQASIDDVQISSKDSTGKCTIYVNTHSTEEHPVDRVKLEYLANSDYAEANLIPGDASWEQTEILDNATCKALAMSVSDLIPDRGKYTWIRLKTFHANETVLYRYSQYWRVRDLETPAATAADDKIKILSATAGADGKSAVIELVWDDGELPSTGTELSWDEEEDAWKSTKDPNNYEFTWSDGPKTIDGDTWGGSAKITIKSLDEASKYFVKARRYNEGDDETTYSEYSNSATVVTSEKPESVTATADRYVPKGSGLNVYWTFAGNGLQREWQIVDSNGTILANGEGSLGSTQIPADRLIAFAEDGDIEFTVQVSTGSGFVVSESKKVTIIESPELSITGSSLVHAHEEAERDFSGEIVTFEPKEDEFVKSLKVPLEPLQDLHGYDHPWVGGNGKNILNVTNFSVGETKTMGGVSCTYDGDGTFTLNGTTTQANVFFNLNYINGSAHALPTNAPFNIGYATENNSDALVRIQAVGGTGYALVTFGVSKAFGISDDIDQTTTTATSSWARLQIQNMGVTITNVKIRPFVCMSSNKLTAYEPYANICPISGWDSVKVTRTGRNFLENGYTGSNTISGVTFTANSDGSISLSGTATATAIIISNFATGLVSTSAGQNDGKKHIPNGRWKVPYMGNNGVKIQVIGTNSPSGISGIGVIFDNLQGTFTVDDTYKYNWVRLYIAKGTVCDGITFYPMILREDDTSTAYEPYNGNTYTTALGRTVYGGTLDVVSGVLTVDRAYVDLGTLTWVSESSALSGVFRSHAPGWNPTPLFLGNLICSQYKAVKNPSYGINNGEVSMTNSQVTPILRVRDESKASMTATEFQTAMNGVQLCYELATPQTYQLDPVQVALLLDGQNNIWNDVGITELKLAEVTLDEDQLQTNDLMLSFKSNKVCDIKLIVTSQGAVGQFPQGILRQTAGDTIHSNVYVPVWAESNDEFTTTVHLPLALDFWDKGSYTLRAVAIDRQTGLKSSEVGLEFSVAWAHQAPSIEPLETYTLSTDITVSDDKNYYAYDSETETYTVVEPVGTENPHNEGWYEVTVTNYVTLTPIDEIDDNGFHHQAVQINLTPPPDADADDVYDIYRMTGDGAQLIGQSFPQTYIATDEYAPFGEDLTNHYRIAVRTADGDVEFSDIEYVLEGEGIRLDWAEGFIEYPYSIGIGDSYKKDVDIRKHLDGSIGAYWNHGVERSGSLSTDAIKILQQDDIDLTRRLGRYTGPVFVRTREGTAFEADVQISNLSSKNIAVMSIAIDATEVDLTEEFMLPTPFNLDEGEQ